jgi:hypothetical protein
MKLISEDIIKSKYLFGYKKGVVISEQDEFLSKLKRRVPQIDDLVLKITDDLEQDAIENMDSFLEDYPDVYSFIDSVVEFIYGDLIAMLKDDSFILDNEGEIKETLKDMYGDMLMDEYLTIAGDEDEFDF